MITWRDSLPLKLFRVKSEPFVFVIVAVQIVKIKRYKGANMHYTPSCEILTEEIILRINGNNNLFWTRFFIGLNHCESTFWKLNSHKVVGHTLISFNKRMSIKNSLEKWALLAFLDYIEHKKMDVLIRYIVGA